MKSAQTLTALGLVLLALAACGRGGPPAPVDMRGIGTGETSPAMAGARNAGSSAATPEPFQGGTYTPPPGYGGRAVQATPLGEPNDAYAQTATQSNSTIRMNPPPPQVVNDPSQPLSMQQRGGTPGEVRVLGTMPATAPVASGSGLQNDRPGAVTATPTAPASASTTTGGLIDQGDGSYGWPVRGRVLSGFGDKPDGQANDGINIAAPLGTPAYAAREGTVSYAGNELRSFGNMVLLQHSGGMYTVYAHLDRILVSKGARVDKGQQVGTVGQSGGVAEPQLHFEVRRNASPQDPMKYLGR